MGLSNFSCITDRRSKQGLVVKVTYTHCSVGNSHVLLLVSEPVPGILGCAPFLPVPPFAFPFLLTNFCQPSAAVSSAGLCGGKPPPDLTWPGKHCCPGELRTREIAKRGAGDGWGRGGSAGPGWLAHREVCARWGWVCSTVALRAASTSQGLVWQPGCARTLGPSRRAHCPPASGGGGGRMPRRDSLSSGLPG